MKNWILATGLCLTLTGCQLYANDYRASDEGDDNIITRNIDVKNFNAIDCESMGNIYFTQSDQFSCRIEGEERLVNLYTFEVKGNELEIDVKKKRVRKTDNVKTPRIYISAPSLRAITQSGVGNFIVDAPLRADDMKLDVNGVGNIRIKRLIARNVDADLSGVGNVEMNVKCGRLTLDVSGVGSVDAVVDCDYVGADLSGIGSVKLSGKAGSTHFDRSGLGSLNTKQLNRNK